MEQAVVSAIKPDWAESRKRFAAWWNGEAHDRALLQVYAPKADAPNDPPPTPPESIEERWLSVDYRLAVSEYRLAATYYGGDAFPYLETSIGPGTLSLYLGAVPTFHETTVWYGRRFDDISTAFVPKYDETNRYWRFSVEMARRGAERFSGRALVGVPDLIEGLDTLSSLLGNDELLLYLVDEPKHVHRLQAALVNAYFDYYDRVYDIVKDEQDGSCFSAFQTYGPGRTAKLQCDFSAMIGPKMYEEFVVPYLAEQCARLDCSVYHLDGPCAMQHLDLLLGIEKLNAIQWTPGAGQIPACHESWIPLYRKIRAAGKSVMVRGGEPAHARPLVEALGPEGLDIAITVDNQEQAEELVKQARGWKRK